MTRINTARPLARAGLLALALSAALWVSAARADGFSARDGSGNALNLRGHTLGTVGGHPDVLPQSGLADSAGNDYSLRNPLPTGPGIVAATPIDRGGTIGASPITIAANTGRKGGWITADPNDTGTIYVSYTGTAATSGGAGVQCVMSAGGSCPMTVNGYVIQTAISIAGTVPGDKVEGVEFQ